MAGLGREGALVDGACDLGIALNNLSTDSVYHS